MSKTALELTPDEWQAYQPTTYSHPNNTELAVRKRRAIQLAHQAAQLLRERFGAQRVVLFGSLSQEAAFTLWSDIDLAAWEIPPEQIYEAVAVVTGLSPDFKIDLVDPDTCRPGLYAAIEQYGLEL